MKPYLWSSLNRQQVGAYAEYFVKMQFTMFGFQVYETEVDDRGIDFVVRHEQGSFAEIQVKSLRGSGYVFMRKAHFELRDELWLALALFADGNYPALYLIPSTRWRFPDCVFVSRDYQEPGQTSAKEWGLNVSEKNLPRLEDFRFDSRVDDLMQRTTSPKSPEPTPTGVTSAAEQPRVPPAGVAHL